MSNNAFPFNEFINEITKYLVLYDQKDIKSFYRNYNKLFQDASLLPDFKNPLKWYYGHYDIKDILSASIKDIKDIGYDDKFFSMNPTFILLYYLKNLNNLKSHLMENILSMKFAPHKFYERVQFIYNTYPSLINSYNKIKSQVNKDEIKKILQEDLPSLYYKIVEEPVEKKRKEKERWYGYSRRGYPAYYYNEIEEFKKKQIQKFREEANKLIHQKIPYLKQLPDIKEDDLVQFIQTIVFPYLPIDLYRCALLDEYVLPFIYIVTDYYSEQKIISKDIPVLLLLLILKSPSSIEKIPSFIYYYNRHKDAINQTINSFKPKREDNYKREFEVKRVLEYPLIRTNKPFIEQYYNTLNKYITFNPKKLPQTSIELLKLSYTSDFIRNYLISNMLTTIKLRQKSMKEYQYTKISQTELYRIHDF